MKGGSRMDWIQKQEPIPKNRTVGRKYGWRELLGILGIGRISKKNKATIGPNTNDAKDNPSSTMLDFVFSSKKKGSVDETNSTIPQTIVIAAPEYFRFLPIPQSILVVSVRELRVLDSVDMELAKTPASMKPSKGVVR